MQPYSLKNTKDNGGEKMETSQIKELIELLKTTDYGYVEIKHEGTQLILSRDGSANIVPKGSVSQKVESETITRIETKNDSKSEDTNEDYHVLKSPMVGTFYVASSPDNPPYVKKGDKVKKGDTLCIIEAMKLMNEIEAEVDGEIVEILVCNEAVVEYGQPMFKIKAV